MGIMITRQVHKPCCGLLWRSINKFYSEITVFCPAFLHSHWSWGEAELCKSILGSIYAKQPGFRAFVARVWLIQSHLIRAGRGAQVLQFRIRMECFGGSGQTRNVHIQLMHLPTLANTLTKSSVHLLGIFWWRLAWLSCKLVLMTHSRAAHIDCVNHHLIWNMLRLCLSTYMNIELEE